jgi:sugar phosphate isomerase/epimerase
MVLWEHYLNAQVSHNMSIDKAYLLWLREALEFTQKHNFDFLEVVIESPLNTTAMEECIRLCNLYKFPKTIHAPFIENNILCTDEFIRNGSVDEILKTMEIAQKIHAERVTIHPGKLNRFREFMKPYLKSIFLNSVKRITDEYQQKYANDFVLCMEIMPKYEGIFTGADEILEFLKTPEFASLHITLDSSHAWCGGGNPTLLDAVKKLNKKIAHFHLVDNDNLATDLHVPLGKGKIDFSSLLQTIKEINYDGTIVVELPGIKNTLDSREYLNNLMKMIEKS